MDLIVNTSKSRTCGVAWLEQLDKKANCIIPRAPEPLPDSQQADELSRWLVRTADDFVRGLLSRRV